MDFCAHRFHTGNQNLLNEVLALDGLEMRKHMKKVGFICLKNI